MEFVDLSDDSDEEPDLVTREERAAAAEAAAIGGRGPAVGGADPSEVVDEALKPVYEAGGGEEEGFELAERDLIRNASHDDGEGFPERDAFTPESDESSAEYGEADKEELEDW